MNKVQKPTTVARAEFISSMTCLINDSGLPPFVIEPILKDMFHDVKMLAQKQLEQDTNNYYRALEQSEQTEEIDSDDTE